MPATRRRRPSRALAGADKPRLLDACANHHGPLSPEIRGRLQRFLDAPSVKTWDEISTLIINPNSMRNSTVWQAVIAVDPTFPKQAKSAPIGKRITAQQRWGGRYPDAITVARALKNACARPK